MDTTTPEGLAAEAEALWPRWAAHLAALAAGPQPAEPAGSKAGARLAQVLQALWQDRGEAAAAAANSSQQHVGWEGCGLLASVASLSALLAAFKARPDPCLELAAATHLRILCCAALLPGSGTKQRLGSPTPTRAALERLCFMACPALLVPAEAKCHPEAPTFVLRADPSLPHQAMLLANALSCWRHHLHKLPGLPSLLEELEWVRWWVWALDALGQAGALTGPVAEMHEALLTVCSRVLAPYQVVEKPCRGPILKRMLEDPRLLPWYTEELLRCLLDEIASAGQGSEETVRGHWPCMGGLMIHWSELREQVAAVMAGQPRLQDSWLEALATLSAKAEAACKAGSGALTWAPLSMLRCWRAVCSAVDVQPFAPAYRLTVMGGFSMLNEALHKRLLASNAAAAQRTEAAAVAAARCLLCVARAIDGWQGEPAASHRADARWNAVLVFQDHLAALNVSPAFSCAAACGRGSPRVPGRRAVAGVIEVLELAAEALQAVVDMPSLRLVHLPDVCEGGATLPEAICHTMTNIVKSFLWQRLPGRQVPLTSCIESEHVQPMLRALLSLLCAQRKAVAWLQRPGRAGNMAMSLADGMTASIVTVTLTAQDLLARTRPGAGSQAEVQGALAARRCVAVAHIALLAALAAHTLPGESSQWEPANNWFIPMGYDLAWQMEEGLVGSTGSGQWSSLHASATLLMRASAGSLAEALAYSTPGEAANLVLSLLASVKVEAAPMPAFVAALASGVFSHLAGWVVRVARRPTNLVDPNVAKALRRLEEVVHMACRAADSLLLPGEEARFAAANGHLTAQVQDALDTVCGRQLKSRKQLEGCGIGTTVRDAWERRRDQLLPPMERGAHCGTAFLVTWQPAGRPASSGGSEAAAGAPRSTCPLPVVQQALALAGVICANPLCTRVTSSSESGDGPALERLQRCRGCRVAGYCCAACGREDWERHRPACNALRRLRRGTASVRPAVVPS